MRLLAISDLHLSKLVSLDPVKKIADHLNDWLILAGDIAENTEFFAASLEILASKFAKLIWVPGNHELWTEPAGCSENNSTWFEKIRVSCGYRKGTRGCDARR